MLKQCYYSFVDSIHEWCEWNISGRNGSRQNGSIDRNDCGSIREWFCKSKTRTHMRTVVDTWSLEKRIQSICAKGICAFYVFYFTCLLQIPTFIYHGIDRKTMLDRFLPIHKLDGQFVCPVVITAYDTILRDFKQLKCFEFCYFIIDEGHRIKNCKSQLRRYVVVYSRILI